VGNSVTFPEKRPLEWAVLVGLLSGDWWRRVCTGSWLSQPHLRSSVRDSAADWWQHHGTC